MFSTKKSMNFSSTLINWYLQNKRDLPWRNTYDPYNIWLSEIILQQTRVVQGLPYYIRFIKNFPKVEDLASATEEEVLKLWQGLGYYSRARNLHETAKFIVNDYNGKFPDNYNDLLKLKGVGEYTAAAIASFSYNENVAVVDGNVFRVLARYFGIYEDISTLKTKKEFQKLANELLPNGNAAVFNQAMMEFGAIKCVPKNPDCSNCVFNSSCFALQKNQIDLLPVKNKKIKVTNRFLNYIIIIDTDNKIILEQRKEKGIWKNMYQFPLIETEKESNLNEIFQLVKRQFNFESFKIINENAIIHKLSHQNLHIKFIEIKILNKHTKGLTFIEAFKKPLPIVLHNFIETNYFDFIKK